MDQKPAWMTAQPGAAAPPGLSPSPPPLPSEAAVPDANNALALAGAKQGTESDDSRYESSSGSDDGEYPAGAICPEMCLVGGPGFAGGSAGSPVSFRITAKDDRGTSITDGGAYVVAKLVPGSTAKAAGAEEVVAAVRDNQDGTYTATYTVLIRGDYQVRMLSQPPVGRIGFQTPCYLEIRTCCSCFLTSLSRCYCNISTKLLAVVLIHPASAFILLVLRLCDAVHGLLADCRDKCHTCWRIAFPCFLQSPGGVAEQDSSLRGRVGHHQWRSNRHSSWTSLRRQ